MSEAVEATVVLADTKPPRPSLLERHFRAKLTRIYAKSADRAFRWPHLRRSLMRSLKHNALKGALLEDTKARKAKLN